MKFTPCQWRYDNLRAWSPQRLAAAKRALLKEADRVQSERDKVALFPEMQQEIQPNETTVEERQANVDRHELFLTRTFRSNRAAGWRKGRAMLFALSPHRRAGVLALWTVTNQPADPAYFIEFVRKYSRPGFSPWTYLRKRQLMRLWAKGIMPRPATFLTITSHFDCLGPVTHPRLRNSTLLQARRLKRLSSEISPISSSSLTPDS